MPKTPNLNKKGKGATMHNPHPRNRPVMYSRDAVLKFLKNHYPNVDWSALEQKLPPVIARAKWDTLSERYGLPYNRRTIGNLDCLGRGPMQIEEQLQREVSHD